MQINKINNVGFGASFDKNTRDWLFVTKRIDYVDTTELEKLLSDNYKDRFVFTTDNDEGVVDIRIQAAPFPVVGVKDIVLFNQDKGISLGKIVPQLVEKMKVVSAERNDWQKQYDEKPY